MCCHLSLPGPLGVDVTAEYVLTWSHVRGVASPTDTTDHPPLALGTSPQWQSLTTESSHHFMEAKVHSIRFLFPLTLYMLRTLSNIQKHFFL